LKEGFVRDYNAYVLKLEYGKKYDYPAYRVRTYCNYKDNSVDVPYDKFVTEVTDVWEERTPIKGFKFEEEPILYLKKNSIWLVEH